MADVTITAANVKSSISPVSGFSQLGAGFILAQFGAAITQGQPVYLNADTKYYPAKSDNALTMPAVGIALEAASTGQWGIICSSDGAFIPGFVIAAGTVYCVSAANAGGVAPIADVEATGDYVQPIYLGGAANAAQLITTLYNGVVHA